MGDFKFTGLGIALITPFKKDKSIDFDALGKLIEFHIEHHAEYYVVLGTTAETPALTAREREEVKRFVAKQVAGRIPLVIGVGGNCTQEVVSRLKSEDFSGYDAILSVVPYYNKPRQEGIYQHYAAIAQASPLPVILYNVPGRTGVNMEAQTTLRLARDFDNIIAVKEASGRLDQAEEILRLRPKGFEVISGDDGLTFPMLCAGAKGVISVLGNAFPRDWGSMVRNITEGYDPNYALMLHNKFAEMNRLIFAEGNPAGIKAALHHMGLIENELRLPLLPVSDALYSKIAALTDSLLQSRKKQ